MPVKKKAAEIPELPEEESNLDDKQDGKKNGKKKGKDKKKKKISFPFVPVIVLLVIIGGIVAVLVFNLFDIREKYIMPYLRNAPLIGRLMPTPEPVAEEEEADEFAGMTREEFVILIRNQGYEIEKLEDDLKAARNQSLEDAETIANLRAVAAIMEDYRQVKLEFDTMIADGDPEAYARFFETISPENAARLYQEVVADMQYSTDEKKFAQAYAEMSPDTAAAAMGVLLGTDASLVVRILKQMDNIHIAAIYDEMTPANVSVITRLMAPTPVPILPVQTAPPLPTPAPVDLDVETGDEAETADETEIETEEGTDTMTEPETDTETLP